MWLTISVGVFCLAFLLIDGAGVGLPKWADPVSDPQGNKRYWKFQTYSMVAFGVVTIIGITAFMVATDAGWRP